jgi:hypothetical protein
LRIRSRTMQAQALLLVRRKAASLHKYAQFSGATWTWGAPFCRP